MKNLNETPFFMNLTQTNDQLKKDRALQLVKQVERVKRKRVEDLEADIDKEQYKLDRLNDLSPKETTDLAYRDDFDPEGWEKDCNLIENKIYALRVKLETAKASYSKQFKPAVDPVK